MLSLIIKPHLSTCPYCFSNNPGIGNSNLLGSLERFSRFSNATIQGVKGGYMSVSTFIQTCSFQDWGETSFNERNGFEIGACILLSVSTLAQHQYSDEFALCTDRC